MAMYRKRPVMVEAIQWTGNNYNEVKEFCGKSPFGGSRWYSCGSRPVISVGDTNNYIRTLNGDVQVSISDYIIKGIDGDFYVCRQDIFEKEYERIDDNEV